jgi:hypothetical protein
MLIEPGLRIPGRVRWVPSRGCCVHLFHARRQNLTELPRAASGFLPRNP